MLELKNIYKTFNPGTVNEKVAIRDLSLHLEKGDFATIIGSNGAGKSTMFNAICGDFLTDSGSVVKEKGTTLLSPNCSSIFEKSILLLSILAGVPVLKRYISMPSFFRESVR